MVRENVIILRVFKEVISFVQLSTGNKEYERNTHNIIATLNFSRMTISIFQKIDTLVTQEIVFTVLKNLPEPDLITEDDFDVRNIFNEK